MNTSLPREALVRIRKLAQLAADLRRGEHFEITRLVVKLGQRGLVTREAGVARSIRVAVAEEDLPALENFDGPPW